MQVLVLPMAAGETQDRLEGSRLPQRRDGMGKTVVFAVAGSGKTTRIVEGLGADQRCLVFTYTEENARTMRRKIALRYGGMPPTVKVMTYFTFLHTFCFRPIMGLKMRNRGLGFSDLPHRDWVKQTDDRYYLDSNGRLYHSRLAKLLIERNLVGDVIERIDQFFDLVCVDEVQDFAGNDFNFLLKLAGARADLLLVGDFRQHTYDTSRDRSVNRSLLRHWLNVRSALAMPGPWLFPSTRTGKPWSKESQHVASKKVMAFAGIDVGRGGTFQLRHTFALRQLRRRHSPEDVARWLGIADPAVMARYQRVFAAPIDVV